jgi:hypothetical protein
MEQSRSLKLWATDMQVEVSQRASIYATAAGLKRGETVQALENFFVRPIFEDPEHPCLPWGGVKREAGIKWVGPKMVFVSEDYLLSGASQEGISNKLSCTPRTISRRLSDSFRSAKPWGRDRGVELIQKRQIARQDSHTSKEAVQQNLADVAISQGVEAAETLRRFFVSGNRVWRSECSLYWVTGLDLHPKRHWRGDLKKAIKSGLRKSLPLRAGDVLFGAQGHVGQS